jgi:hypothetical protein
MLPTGSAMIFLQGRGRGNQFSKEGDKCLLKMFKPYKAIFADHHRAEVPKAWGKPPCGVAISLLGGAVVLFV